MRPHAFLGKLPLVCPAAASCFSGKAASSTRKALAKQQLPAAIAVGNPPSSRIHSCVSWEAAVASLGGCLQQASTPPLTQPNPSRA
mmetsp:Transcript_36517/g.107870  ORF Transcript_36517/g.107870 Transcript_36517/m.107870 type:complete len:86 (+) Transcript_36517:67-324(+)